MREEEMNKQNEAPQPQQESSAAGRKRAGCPAAA